ncbi:uncharacterized protein LOC117343087 isoform X2 [Pecten maximus]|nr:uncharacterized protein LOC117343087 isoform X2 [Pecten maximus]XP_033761268.1 uncharacterized protein LOC117343087 isoform X2 [Pecten maximus]XP_033761269.1 uncharacterized protein LOC117343087 isoform X2 [Pecten maximus]
MAYSWNVPTEIIELHNEMVYKLDNEMDSGAVYRLKYLFNGIPFTPKDLSSIDDMPNLIDCLMKYETIQYGQYGPLTDKLEKVNKQMRTMVKKYTEKMAAITGTRGNPTAHERTDQARFYKRIRSGADMQTYHQPDRPDTEGASTYHGSQEEDDMQVVEATDQNLRTERDWQFYLDWLSEKIHDEISTVATHLSISSDQQKRIEKDNNTVHEKCFHMLWEWFRSRKNNMDKVEDLHQALTFAERADILEDPMPQPAMYRFQSNSIPHPNKTLTELDLLKVSNEIGAQYPSLARYFRINESEIHASKYNKDEIKAQARDVLLKCLKSTLLQTRQQLCDGLHYKNRRDIIDLLVQRWSSS